MVKKASMLPDGYYVTDDGRIFNKKTGKYSAGSVHKRTGYVRLTLTNGKQYLLHRVVAQEFCEKRDGCTEVNHKDGDKTNNQARNLEWVTRAENLKHAYETHLRKTDVTPKRVLATCIRTGETKAYESIYQAAKALRISNGNICMCCKGQRPYANGHIWRYA